MTSGRKIESNRNNAKKSTGPRSEAGRQISRYNARRHGLAVAISADPSFSNEIETLAKALSAGIGGQTVGEFAREAAEADIDLQRIRKTRALRFGAVVGNLEAQPQTYAQLAEDLVKIERYERRASHDEIAPYAS